jgi:diguanylate cyclase (GGDEF)-like protein
MPIFLASEINIQEIESQMDTFPIAEKIEALNILSYHFRLSEPFKSLDYALLALDLSESINAAASIYESLENCAIIYGLSNDFPKAKEYYLRALEVNNRLQLPENEITIYSNLAFLEQTSGNPEAALAYYDKLLTILNATNNQSKKTETLAKMARIYKELELYELAFEYYVRSLESDEQIVKDILTDSNFEQHFGDDSTAISYYSLLLQSLSPTSDSTDNTEMNEKADEEIKELLEKENKLQKMLQEAKKETSEREKTLEFIQQEKALKELEIERKDLELQNYQLELQKKELDIIRQKTLRNYFLVVILVFLFLVILNFLLYSVKQKDNRILQQAYEEISVKNDTLLLMNKKLEEIARTDPLTNLSNRRDMLEKLDYEKVRFSRGNQSFVIIICDIDNFKKINDTYGHDFGDVVLKRISSIMKKTLRKQDVVSRWGGEEFLLLLPETTITGGIIAAEKIRKAISQERFEQSGKKIQVTMTFGVEIFDKLEETIATINRADQALYHGKNTGKNQVVSYDSMKK